MSSSCRSSERDARVGSIDGAEQSFHEVLRKKRRVAGGGYYKARVRRGCCGPAQSGQHASQRPGEVLRCIRDDGESAGRKARRVAIGIENDRICLLMEALNDMADQ